MALEGMLPDDICAAFLNGRASRNYRKAQEVMLSFDSCAAFQGGTTPETNEIVTNICSCHNFFSLSSVKIIFIPACCLLCVL